MAIKGSGSPMEAVDEYFDMLIKSRFNEMFECIDLSAQKPDWISIGEVGTILTGSTPKTNEPSYWDGDLKWIAPAELTSESFIINDTERKITEEGRKSCSLNLLEPGVVLLSSRAPIGKVAIVGSEMYCNQGFKNIKCGPKLNNVFLFVLLKNNTEYLNSLGRGATFKEISAKIVENIRIPVPPIEDQNRFVDFFMQVDKSKAIVQKCIDKYDLLVKSRFIEMFNPFLKDTKYLSDVAIFLRNGANIKQEKSAKGYPITRIETLANGVFNIDRLGYADIFNLDKYEGYILQPGDLLISHINSGIYVGKTVQYHGENAPIIHGMNLLCLRLNDECSPTFFEYYMKTNDARAYIKTITKQSVNQASFSVSDLKKMPIPIPPKDVQHSFELFLKQVDKSKFVETVEPDHPAVFQNIHGFPSFGLIST
ncbi:restriction endonuclease subunit S [Methanomethylophilus alvi]|uniref:restriction endonuclease subunit S n=1 Tax=Methanomethylophilus alvi TaxID=1291540 RepID=UPI0037DD17B6